MTTRAADRIQRLDAALRSRFPDLSRREIHLAIATGVVRVNGRRARKGDRVGLSDDIAVGPLLDPPAIPRGIPVPILHIDRHVIAIDKPPGVPSTARRLTRVGSIAGFLLRRFPDLAAAGRSPLEAGLVHRLDTGTSGVLLAARSPEGWANLRRQFARRRVEKQYLALVHGRLAGARDLRHALAHDPRNRARMTISPRPAPRRRRGPSRSWTAEARVVAIESATGMTLVAVTLFTGVTHQIRAQLAAIGHPVAGDIAYGAPAGDEPGIPRPLLHAASLSFDHPHDARRCTLSSMPPRDFAHVLARVGIKENAQTAQKSPR